MVRMSQLLRVRTWKDGFWSYLAVGVAAFLSGVVIAWLGIYLFLRHALPGVLAVCFVATGAFFFILSVGSMNRRKWALKVASAAYTFLSLFLWILVFIPSGALESSPTWGGTMAATILSTLPVVAAVAYYGTWVVAQKRRAGERQRVLRVLAISITCLLLLPVIAAAGMYGSDRTGHSIGFGFTFAYRESHVSIDNNRQTFVYATDTTPDELAKKFSSATSIPTSFNLPNRLSDIGAYTTVIITDGSRTYTMTFCEQSSSGCKALLTKGAPFGGSVYAKKYVVAMDNNAYQFLHRHSQ